jgi:aminomethyltransferase
MELTLCCCCCTEFLSIVKLHGKDRTSYLETLVVGDIAALDTNQSVLSLLTNATGGIIDDTIITNKGDHISMVVNGACKHKDIAHMEGHLATAKAKGQDVAMEVVYDHEMFALQGPKAMQVLDTYVKGSGVDLIKMPFMSALPMTLLGVPCKVVRCGYTGEDGFEISMPSHFAVELWDSLISKEEVHETGLGARDSLRLEAGLCLYGNDATRYAGDRHSRFFWRLMVSMLLWRCSDQVCFSLLPLSCFFRAARPHLWKRG